jgi:redox-sensitive bicupin YhaK (pirin superfamily)
MTKKITATRKSNGGHWVGNGFPVRNIFDYGPGAEALSPFLLMDYAGPVEFDATTEKRGVGEHPHRGFETVSIVYKGQVSHRDSGGGGGTIGPGDVQWMTAGSGVVHEEFHGRSYAETGGPFEMIQLWVNLPKKDKMTKPRYQGISDGLIPAVPLAEGAGTVRIIAGKFENIAGPALTFSPMNVWDLAVKKGATVRLPARAGETTALFVMKGSLTVGYAPPVGEAELALLDPAGDGVEFLAVEECRILFLNGAPLNEPIVGYGPFVMNTEAEIRQAFEDYKSGRMGHLKD